ncbi:MAG: acyl-CoA dehydrogenase [Anaerolineaceae bacterium]|nr:acyl-CoA dehydrogenase [Anaerolineaceae bacterium]MCB9097909.1 acyl-CoA dehydrogenase [Anaerolineales bacterium]
MDFQLNEEQRMIQAAARDFAQNEIAKVAAHYDETGDFPAETIGKMGALGFFGIEVPEAYGGAEMDTLSHMLVIQEISKVDAAHGTILSANNTLVCYPLMAFGTEEQKQKYLVPVASGEKIGAYSLTEPASGSDAGTMRSRAVRDGDHYLISGTKSWVTNGANADFLILFTMTNPEAGHRGITAFIIEAGQPGLQLGRKEDKLGIRASATCELYFDNYRCPVENRLGEEGQGFKIAMTVLDSGRIGIAAQSVGIAEAAYEASVKYARERQAFGGPIGQFQGIQWKIADMKSRLEASRLLMYRAAVAKEEGKTSGARFTTEAAVAKLFASETAMFCAHQAVQIHAGMGYSKEMPIERYFRDAKITEIYEGTNEIQRMIIARNELQLR